MSQSAFFLTKIFIVILCFRFNQCMFQRLKKNKIDSYLPGRIRQRRNIIRKSSTNIEMLLFLEVSEKREPFPFEKELIIQLQKNMQRQQEKLVPFKNKGESKQRQYTLMHPLHIEKQPMKIKNIFNSSNELKETQESTKPFYTQIKASISSNQRINSLPSTIPPVISSPPEEIYKSNEPKSLGSKNYSIPTRSLESMGKNQKRQQKVSSKTISNSKKKCWKSLKTLNHAHNHLKDHRMITEKNQDFYTFQGTIEQIYSYKTTLIEKYGGQYFEYMLRDRHKEENKKEKNYIYNIVEGEEKPSAFVNKLRKLYPEIKIRRKLLLKGKSIRNQAPS